jgi:hypothetical protein
MRMTGSRCVGRVVLGLYELAGFQVYTSPKCLDAMGPTYHDSAGIQGPISLNTIVIQPPQLPTYHDSVVVQVAVRLIVEPGACEITSTHHISESA